MRRVEPARSWTFLTNHGLVLLVIAHDPHARMRDIAAAIDVTERTAQRIVTDLINAGHVSRERPGRRNVYTVRTDLPLRHPLEREIDIGALLAVLAPAGTTAADRHATARIDRAGDDAAVHPPPD